MNKQANFYKNGYCYISREELLGVEKFLVEVKRINESLDKFEYQGKQKGTATLILGDEYLHELFVNFLFESTLIERVTEIVGHTLFMANYKHYLTRGSAKSLGWHRDTYLRGTKLTGLLPVPYKLAIYSSVSNKFNACTEVISGSHRFDMHSRVFDKVLTLTGWHRRQLVARPGDAVIFDASILHNRVKALEESYRSATIFGFSSSNFNLEKYKTKENLYAMNLYRNNLGRMKI